MLVCMIPLWRYLELSRAILNYLELPWPIWRFLSYLAVCSYLQLSVWSHLEVFVAICSNLGLSGAIRINIQPSKDTEHRTTNTTVPNPKWANQKVKGRRKRRYLIDPPPAAERRACPQTKNSHTLLENSTNNQLLKTQSTVLSKPSCL